MLKKSKQCLCSRSIMNLTSTMILEQIMPAIRRLQIWKPKRANISGNGTNFSLVLMIREASGWKIGGICKCPRDLGSVPAGITVSRQSYGFVSYQSQPSYIKVKDENGTVKNVAFSTYLKNVTYNEIGNMGYYDEAIKANVMAIKMCGWWAHAAGYRSAEGCDIKYGDVAYKSSYQTKPAITNAINAVDGKNL